jgi:mannose-6-phosphate isomerase-like protein (cupin superfamily)
MSPFREVKEKGLERCWVEATLTPEQMNLHITELPPGAMPHPPHTHSGVEAFCLLEGSGEIETEAGPISLQANQAVILEASRRHSIVNTGSVPMKYIVITAKA